MEFPHVVGDAHLSSSTSSTGRNALVPQEEFPSLGVGQAQSRPIPHAAMAIPEYTSHYRNGTSKEYKSSSSLSPGWKNPILLSSCLAFGGFLWAIVVTVLYAQEKNALVDLQMATDGLKAPPAEQQSDPPTRTLQLIHCGDMESAFQVSTI
jgi:hypothetical protein